jgi:hypothetical protein
MFSMEDFHGQREAAGNLFGSGANFERLAARRPRKSESGFLRSLGSARMRTLPPEQFKLEIEGKASPVRPRCDGSDLKSGIVGSLWALFLP